MQFIVNLPSLTKEEAEEKLLAPHGKIALDIETVSLDNQLPLGIAVAISPDIGYYFFNPKDDLLSQVVMSSPLVLFHNAAYDIPILDTLGLRIRHFEDTMLLAYSAGILNKSLEALSTTILHRKCPSVTDQWKKKDQGNIAIDHVKMGSMSIIHACNTYALWERIPKVPLYSDIDRPCIDLVLEMEKWGVLIDQHKLTEVEQESVVRANKLELEIKEELGLPDINLASNPQVAEAFRAKGIIGTRKTKSAKDSVGEESLKPLDHPLANKLLKWRSVMKTLSTYIPAFRSPDVAGRIHTKFGYTNTGRWSSSKPNLQNITRDETMQVEEE